MSSHARRILLAGALRKRKEREDAKSLAAPRNGAEPSSSDRLLAGYMAHEFLTRGTLLGEKWDPARAEAGITRSGSSEPKKAKPGESREAEPNRSYAEVAGLLKGNGAHVAGVVNPTQLASWIHM